MGAPRILLIEDDLNVYHGIRRKLRAFHYDTLYAPDAVASICQARLHHPDLILLDLSLPAGDGFGVMESLKRSPELPLIPVVVLSGRDRAANEARAFRAGAAAFLQKPVCGQLLVETISRCLADACSKPLCPNPPIVSTHKAFTSSPSRSPGRRYGKERG